MSRLQNEDHKTLDELISRGGDISQLLNTDKIWDAGESNQLNEIVETLQIEADAGADAPNTGSGAPSLPPGSGESRIYVDTDTQRLYFFNPDTNLWEGPYGANAGGEANTITNVGVGAGNIYKDKVGENFNLKTVQGGTNITITDGTDEVTVETSAEINTASNVGTGEGSVFKDKVSENLRLKTIKAGTNITITDNADDITIESSATSGENNTASNVGAGSEVFKQKTGVDLELRTITGTSPIVVTEGADSIDISYVDPFPTPPGEANTASNVGGGAELFKQKNGSDLEFRTLTPFDSNSPSLVTSGDNIQLKPKFFFNTYADDASANATYGANLVAGNAGKLYYFNTTDDVMKVFNGVGWDVLNPANSTVASAGAADAGKVVALDSNGLIDPSTNLSDYDLYVYNNTGQSVVHNTAPANIIFNVIDKNSGGDYNAATGEWTAPFAMKAEVKWGSFLNTISGRAYNFFVYLYLNGTAIGYGYKHNAVTSYASPVSSGGSKEVYLSSGDILTVRIYQANGGGATHTLNASSHANFMSLKILRRD